MKDVGKEAGLVKSGRRGGIKIKWKGEEAGLILGERERRRDY